MGKYFAVAAVLVLLLSGAVPLTRRFTQAAPARTFVESDRAANGFSQLPSLWANDEAEVGPGEVVIAGPTVGVIQEIYTFTASVNPVSVTIPITYAWWATGNENGNGQEVVTRAGGLSDTVALAWEAASAHVITVVAANGAGAVTASHAISIDAPVQASRVYLPFVLREYTLPSADFWALPTAGVVPLTVRFTDISRGIYVSNLWAFGDGITSTLSSPTHTYSAVGPYTVTLTIDGPEGRDGRVRADYITVYTTAVRAGFIASPTMGVAPLTVTFTNTSTGLTTTTLWSFGNGVTSTRESPTHTYAEAGAYTVTLTASGVSGTDTLSRANYITVSRSLICIEGISSGGFESGIDWVIPTTEHPATYTTAVTRSGDHAMRVGIVEPDENRYSFSSAWQTVSIPVEAVSVTLRFWLYTLSGEPSADIKVPARPLANTVREAAQSGDRQYVVIYEWDNWVNTLIWQRTNDQGWKFYEFDLGVYAGRTIKLWFGAYNDGWDGVTAMYVDDVFLEVCCPVTGSGGDLGFPRDDGKDARGNHGGSFHWERQWRTDTPKLTSLGI